MKRDFLTDFLFPTNGCILILKLTGQTVVRVLKILFICASVRIRFNKLMLQKWNESYWIECFSFAFRMKIFLKKAAQTTSYEISGLQCGFKRAKVRGYE